ncbi:MAG: inorganic phosphate transporter, partial [Candidatus Syntrophosphaera sp.]
VMGIGLAKGGKNIRFNVLGRLSLAWVAAPVLAFLFSFVALFITQNVFELHVQRPITYTVDKAAVQEMEERGIDTNKLSFVNMRSFDSQRAFYEELTDADAYEPEVAKQIVAICEDHPLKVDFQALSSRKLDERFTPAQLEALAELDGREFRRKWELGSELARYDAWQPIEDPQTKEDKERNRALRNRLDILHNVFYDPLPEGE